MLCFKCQEGEGAQECYFNTILGFYTNSREDLHVNRLVKLCSVCISGVGVNERTAKRCTFCGILKKIERLYRLDEDTVCSICRVVGEPQEARR